MEGATGSGGVHIVSWRMVRPTVSGNCCHRAKEEEDAEVIHLTPGDQRLINIDYIQKGILLPKPPSTVSDNDNDLVNALQSSFARALRLFYPFAGRRASEEHADHGTVPLFLRCTGEGAEFVHAVAPEVAVADIISSLYTPPVVWKFYPLSFVLGADAAIERLPVLAVQVTVLADGVFIGMTLNHSAGDGTAFWHFFNTWSGIHRADGSVGIVSADLLGDLSTPPPVFDRWFLETCPVPIPMPFRKLEHIVRRFERTPLKECFVTFSVASVKKLKARANDEMAGGATASISSLQAVLAHFWRAVCRARRLTPEQRTFYSVIVGCRGRVNGIPPAGYLGNALVFGKAEATAGEIEARCYTAASVPPEKLIIGRTLTGLGVFLELTNPRGGDYRRVHVKAHVGDVADIQIAYKHGMQLAIQICKCMNFENVMFLENQFLVTAQGVVKTRQSTVNKTAHKLAKQARQSISQRCCFTCNTESHLGCCPVLEALRNRKWGDYSLISVRCF